MKVSELKAILGGLPDDMEVSFIEFRKRTWHAQRIRAAYGGVILSNVDLLLANEESAAWSRVQMTAANIAEMSPTIREAFERRAKELAEKRSAASEVQP